MGVAKYKLYKHFKNGSSILTNCVKTKGTSSHVNLNFGHTVPTYPVNENFCFKVTSILRANEYSNCELGPGPVKAFETNTLRHLNHAHA